MNFDIQWGGFYVSRTEHDESFTVFRLLDFNRFCYHIAIFKERFTALPALDEVTRLSPHIGHVPIDSKALLQEKEIHLLGGLPLTERDLEGYRCFLEDHEMEPADIATLLTDIVEFGNGSPLKVTLTINAGELDVTER
jgi:hypothetical protein